MKTRIEPYREEMVEAVMQFNERLNSAASPYSSWLAGNPISAVSAMTAGAGFRQECFLALEGAAVRGGYTLYHQLWSIRGETIAVANCMRPISEGVIDRAYGMVGVRLIHDALRRQPLQFGLGLGNSPMTRVLRAMGWDIWPVPFYFKVTNGARFLKNLQALRRNPAGSLLVDLAAGTGLASLGARVVSAVSSRRVNRRFSVEAVDSFSCWSDQLWNAARRAYAVLEERDSGVLNLLFSGRPGLTCLKVSEGPRPLGWVVLEAISSNQIRFGSMKVQSIMDCLALPEDADVVIHAAVKYLEARDVDLIISNQSHRAWRRALRHSGFLGVSSTFLFASAPSLTQLLHAADPSGGNMHFTRGGGDVAVPLQGGMQVDDATVPA